MQLISTITVGAGGTTSIDFTSIPQTGDDLLVVFSGRVVGSPEGTVGASVFMNFNSDYGANYSHRHLTGDGSTTYSGNGSSAFVGWTASSAATASTFSSMTAYIPNYRLAVVKSWSVDHSVENNAANARNTLVAGRWTGTAAITTVSFANGASNFVQGTTASLYIITKGSGGATIS